MPILSYKNGFTACSSTIVCLVMIFRFRFPTLRFSLGHGYEVKAEPYRTGNMCTAATRSSPEGMRERMDEFNRLSEAPTSKPALFMNAKLVAARLFHETSSNILPTCCSARELQYIILISRVTCSTGTDFSHNL